MTCTEEGSIYFVKEDKQNFQLENNIGSEKNSSIQSEQPDI